MFNGARRCARPALYASCRRLGAPCDSARCGLGAALDTAGGSFHAPFNAARCGLDSPLDAACRRAGTSFDALFCLFYDARRVARR